MQAEKKLAQDGIVGVDKWTVLLEEYQAKLFTVEKAKIDKWTLYGTLWKNEKEG